MNIRKICPKPLFPYLQKLCALRDILLFEYYKKRFKADPLGVLMVSPSRNTLSGNHEFISNKLENSEFKVSYLLEDDCKNRKKRLKALASNRFILLDDYTPFIYTLTFPNTIKIVQVWHSTGAFKRMGFARMGRPGSTVETSLTHKNYTHVIVSSSDVVENFCEAFGIGEEKIFPIGVPRTDLFFDEAQKQSEIDSFYETYPEIKGKKLVLFAPTFRGDTRSLAHYKKEWFNPVNLIKSLPEDYCLGIKLHPFITEKMDIPLEFRDRIFDFSCLREINPLLFVTDTLITDYSSVIFEYSLLNKPIIFYLPDFEEYNRDRSFFYPFSEYIYGNVCRMQTELSSAILNPQDNEETRKIFNDKFLSSCDGNSTNRFINEILRK